MRKAIKQPACSGAARFKRHVHPGSVMPWGRGQGPVNSSGKPIACPNSFVWLVICNVLYLCNNS